MQRAAYALLAVTTATMWPVPLRAQQVQASCGRGTDSFYIHIPIESMITRDGKEEHGKTLYNVVCRRLECEGVAINISDDRLEFSDVLNFTGRVALDTSTRSRFRWGTFEFAVDWDSRSVTLASRSRSTRVRYRRAFCPR